MGCLESALQVTAEAQVGQRVPLSYLNGSVRPRARKPLSGPHATIPLP
jgi:hypothetical protein